MCLSEAQARPSAHLPQDRDRLSPPQVQDNESSKLFSATLDAMACRPSWTLRNIFKSQSPRPGLTRRLHGSAKINLNDYWGVLEHLVHVDAPAPPQAQEEEEAETDRANEINENLSNERLEVQSGELVQQHEQVAMEVEAAAAPSPPVEVEPSSSASCSGRRKRPLVVLPGRARRARMRAPKTVQENATVPTRSPLAAVNGIENHQVSRSPRTQHLSPLSCITENFARRLGKLI